MEVKTPVAERPEASGSPSQGTMVKKLKQSLLPFQVLSSNGNAGRLSASLSTPVGAEIRKRKPSTESLDLQNVAKVGRISETPSTPPVALYDDDAADDEREPLGRSFRSERKKKNKQKRSTANQCKIFIKLPMAKRKRSRDKNAAEQNSKSLAALVDMDQISDAVMIDDTDESEELETNDPPKTGQHSKDSESTADVKQLLESSSDGLEAKDPLVHGTPSKRSEANEETDKIGLKDSIVNLADSSEEDHQQTNGEGTSINNGTSSPASYKQDDSHLPGSPVKREENGHLLTTEDSTIPTANRTPPSDFHSSEEDIYMLCTPNTKTVPSSAEKSASRKLTPKQIALRLHREKTRALKEQQKEEKRLQLQKEKDEKAREKEEQERQRRKEREEKDEQKRKEREEKEDLKRKERLEKEQAKQKERDEKEEQRRKEREEKEKRRQDELEQKLEEKRLKDEERRRKEEQKEEERKRRDEEKEAEEKKKQKVAEAFTSFFVKKPSAATTGVLKASDDENSLGNMSTGATGVEGMEVAPTTGTGTPARFMPFCVKGDMRLAPTTRASLDSTQKRTLDAFLEEGSFVALKPVLTVDKLYLAELTSRCHNPRTSEKTWNTEEDEDENDDMMIGDDETVCHQIEEDPEKMKQRFKVKFFLFDENQRPPYRGTWRKRSQQISARRPFALDTQFFDYDVDSDDEWEEEEPGESLHGSDDEKDVDHEEEYEVDNEFFVPHGHLSDEELQAEGEDADGDPALDDNRPQVQKAKLKILQQEFVAEMKKKTEKIKPRLIGCIWENGGQKTGYNARPDCSAIIWKMLTDRAMLYDPAEPISFTLPSAGPTNSNDSEADPEAQSPGKENEKGPKRVRITDDAVCDLMRLVHGNTNKSKFLVREFQAFWRNLNGVTFSLESIHLKIREVASWGVCTIDGPMLGKLCWTVDDEILKMHKLTTLTLPNEWKYSLEGNNQARRHAAKRRAQEEAQETGQQADESVSNKHPSRKKVKHSNGHVTLKTQSVPNAPATVSITKFTKKLSADEKMKMLTGSEKNSPKQRDALEVPETVTSLKPVDSKPIKMGATPSPTLKKRAQLLSVPRVKELSSKLSPISKFLAKTPNKSHTEAVQTSS